MKRKKSLRSKLTRISKSKQKTAKPVYQMRIGIEAHIEYHQFLDDWGNDYQSILRTGIIDRQKGLSEEDLERTYQKRFDIQWAWADSLATNISQVYDQLKTAKENQLEMLREDIKSGEIKVKEKITQIESDLNNPTAKNSQNMDKRLLGLKSKIERLNRKKLKLERLKNTEKIHICWGSKKLFKAQHHLEENGYKSHQEWLCDWRKKRGGNFSSIGKGSVKGNNPMTPIHFMKDDIFSVTIKIR